MHGTSRLQFTCTSVHMIRGSCRVGCVGVFRPLTLRAAAARPVQTRNTSHRSALVMMQQNPCTISRPSHASRKRKAKGLKGVAVQLQSLLAPSSAQPGHRPEPRPHTRRTTNRGPRTTARPHQRTPGRRLTAARAHGTARHYCNRTGITSYFTQYSQKYRLHVRNIIVNGKVRFLVEFIGYRHQYVAWYNMGSQRNLCTWAGMQ